METYKILDEYGNIIGEAKPWTDEMSKREEQHVQALERLCRDMYETMHYLDPRHVYEYYTKRMADIGLLEGEQND